MTSSWFDLSSTVVRSQKPWTSPFYGSINGPSLKTLAKVWADLFPCRLTWDDWKVQNARSLEEKPKTTVEIETGTSMGFSIAWKTSMESDSKMTSLTPMSHAKIVASSIAFASASKGSNGRGRRLLKAATTYEARVRFGTRVRVRVRVRDSAIFEKGGCGCGRTRRLKNY